jgi:hypothetical protein
VFDNAYECGTRLDSLQTTPFHIYTTVVESYRVGLPCTG